MNEKSNNPDHPRIISIAFDYANLVTLLGALFSICGVFFAINGNLYFSAAALAAALLADMCDGWVARLQRNRAKKMAVIGVQLDSLCDVLHGGVLPAIIFCTIQGWPLWSLAVAVGVILCAIIRLAYFSVFGPEPDGSWRGLPVIFNSFFVSLWVLLLDIPFVASVFPVLMIALLALNVCDFRMPKIKGKTLAAFNAACFLIILTNTIQGISI